jgi:hypothetical protein
MGWLAGWSFRRHALLWLRPTLGAYLVPLRWNVATRCRTKSPLPRHRWLWYAAVTGTSYKRYFDGHSSFTFFLGRQSHSRWPYRFIAIRDDPSPPVRCSQSWNRMRDRDHFFSVLLTRARQRHGLWLSCF